MSRDPWVLVRDESELRSGMCVELRPCAWCGRRERIILTREGPQSDGVFVDGSIRYGKGFSVPSKCMGAGEYGFDMAIAERRLYRLADETATDETRTTKRRREVTR